MFASYFYKKQLSQNFMLDAEFIEVLREGLTKCSSIFKLGVNHAYHIKYIFGISWKNYGTNRYF